MASAPVSTSPPSSTARGELGARQLQVGDAEHHPQPATSADLRHRERLQQHSGCLARLDPPPEGSRPAAEPPGRRSPGPRWPGRRAATASASSVVAEPLGDACASAMWASRNVGGVPTPSDGLPGGPGLVGQALPLEAPARAGRRPARRTPGARSPARCAPPPGPRPRPRAPPAPPRGPPPPGPGRAPLGSATSSAKILAAPSSSPHSASLRAVSADWTSSTSAFRVLPRIRRRPEPNDSGRVRPHAIPPICRPAGHGGPRLGAWTVSPRTPPAAGRSRPGCGRRRPGRCGAPAASTCRPRSAGSG